ncbi:MucBP domain-containing protein [Levilactobacillus lanxiensis]|uniref:MucBP domain-containing protein n=1 Tax=Levilactobacillus lanxiensis TaxID=2799568 RepID=A0ABW4D1K8_9LACO|nr:MucBP domain-containing protein [Levilactobacillus lanxiensis]
MDKVIRKYKIMYNADKRWLVMTTVAVSLVWGILDSQPVSADVVPDAGANQENVMADSNQETILNQQKTQTLTVTEKDPATDEADKQATKDGEGFVQTPVADPQTPSNSETIKDSNRVDSDGIRSTDTSSQEKTDSVDENKVTEKPTAVASVNQSDRQATLPDDSNPVVVNKGPEIQKLNPKLRSIPSTQTSAVTVVQPVAETEESIDEWMPNTKLQAEILKTLNNISPNGKRWKNVRDITQSDMLYLTSLNGSGTTWIDGHTPYSLEGLQYATNLTSIVFNGLAQAQDALSPIYSGIEDISPLKNLTKLQTVWLECNSISDVTPLANLKNVTSLQLEFNKISDFSSLNPNQYTYFNYESQFITLPKIYVSSATRTAEMPFRAYLPGGQLAPLIQGGGATLVPAEYITPSTEKFWLCGRGGVATEKDGGLVYTNLKNNGLYPFSKYSGAQVVPNQLLFYMVGTYAYPASTSEPFIVVVQPYEISDSLVSVTVRYLDEQRKPLRPNNIVNGVIGKKFSFDAPNIAGYETPSTITGIFSPTPKPIDFIYKKATMTTVAVYYKDESGNPIHDNIEISGQIGKAYNIDYLDIDGYTYKETQGDAQGIFTDKPTKVTFVYNKNTGTVTPPVVTPEQKITVTVHYQTADGTMVAPDVTVTGKVGDTYTTSPAVKVADGYQLSVTPANASGTLGNKDFAVTYIYEKTGGTGDKITPDTDRPTTQLNKPAITPSVDKQIPAKKPQTGDQTDTLTGSHGNQAVTTAVFKAGKQTDQPNISKTVTGSLPQTNDDEQSSQSWGIALLVMVLGLFGLKLKHKEQ